MAEYIEKGEFIAHIRKEAEGLQTEMPMDLVIEGVANEAKKFPSADVQPVRHGRWINHGWSTVCSECGEDYAFAKRNYCPNCGAVMMDGKENKNAEP